MKEFINTEFGTQVSFAEEMNVTVQTVQNWIKKPVGILKHLQKIQDITGLPADEIIKRTQ